MVSRWQHCQFYCGPEVAAWSVLLCSQIATRLVLEWSPDGSAVSFHVVPRWQHCKWLQAAAVYLDSGLRLNDYVTQVYLVLDMARSRGDVSTRDNSIIIIVIYKYNYYNYRQIF